MTDAESTSSGPPPTQTVSAPGMKWYVLRVASNKEEQVRDTLLRKIAIEGLDDHVGRVLVPTLKEKRVKGGVVRLVNRKLYPGYVLWRCRARRTGRSPKMSGL